MPNRSLATVCMALSAVAFLVTSARPAQAQPRRNIEVTDENVAAAVRKGVEYIWQLRDKHAEPHWEPETDADFAKKPAGGHSNRGGMTALALLGLVHSGEDPNSKRFVESMEWLHRQEGQGTYFRGLRAALWGSVDRKYHKLLRADVDLLVNGIWDWGFYGYGPRPSTTPFGSPAAQGFKGDFSNTQYGILGVWAGAERDLEVPRRYWLAVQKGCIEGQQQDGGWAYHTVPSHKRDGLSPEASRPQLSLGALASLLVVWDKLYASGNCDRRVDPALLKSLDAGIAYLGKAFDNYVERPPGSLNPYLLYAMERGGVASGLKYFGRWNWALEGTRIVLNSQQADGSWPGGYAQPCGTAWTLLFLSYGGAPVLFNKLSHGQTDDWNSRPRDLANLTRWLPTVFERKVNWQIVSADKPEDLHDAPILFLTGRRPIALTDEHKQALKQFMLRGGTILASPSGPEFARSLHALCREWFPMQELSPVADTDPLYTIHEKTNSQPRLLGINNGVRWQILISQDDIACSWQRREVATKRALFGFAANLYNVVSDRGRLRGRGQSYTIADAGNKPAQSVTVGRWIWGTPLQSDPEPAAWAMQDIRLRNAGTMGITIMPTDLRAPLDPAAVPLLHVTGVTAIVADDAAKANLKAYLEGGGILLADAAGGLSNLFSNSIQKLLGELFGQHSLTPPATLPQFVLDAADEDGRSWFRHRFDLPRGLRPVDMLTIRHNGRICAMVLPYDLSSAMVGYTSLLPVGFMPESADKFVTELLKSLAK